MKQYAMWTMVGLMCMAPAAFAQDSNHTGHEATTGDTVAKKTPHKKMAKGNKKVKPLTTAEQKELDHMKSTSTDKNAESSSGEEKAEVK